MTKFVIEFPAPIEDWTSAVAQSSEATFFHSPEWFRIIADIYPDYELAAARFAIRDGPAIILPLMVTWRSKATGAVALMSSPLFTYGGAVSAQPVDSKLLAEAIEKIPSSPALRAASLRIIGNPYQQIAIDPPFEKDEGYTHVVDLQGGYDSVKGRYQRSQKEGLNKARRFGLVTRIADKIEDWRQYYGLYEQSLARWGGRATSHYPWELFERLSRCNPDSVKLWLVESDGVPCAGALVVYKHPRACSWHASFAEEYSKQKPNNLLQDAILKDACERGFLTYDLLSSGTTRASSNSRSTWVLSGFPS